jgi:hypothetical protein
LKSLKKLKKLSKLKVKVLQGEIRLKDKKSAVTVIVMRVIIAMIAAKIQSENLRNSWLLWHIPIQRVQT